MSGLRVISGKARGRKLRSVPGDSTRPITDRTKESLFNILSVDIIEARFLDLFAGTGSVGIEALSRGANYARFVDTNALAVKTMRANLKSTQLSERGEVWRMDALRLLGQVADQQFDYIYIAPPQYKQIWKHTLVKLDQHMDWLADDAWVIVQIHPIEYEDTKLDRLEEFDQRKYGSTLLVFYQQKIEGLDKK